MKLYNSMAFRCFERWILLEPLIEQRNVSLVCEERYAALDSCIKTHSNDEKEKKRKD